jgi:hypothetical protein
MANRRVTACAVFVAVLLAASRLVAGAPVDDARSSSIWPGRWGYTECVGNPQETGHDCTAYRLAIRAEPGRYTVEVEIETAGHIRRILASGRVDGDAFIISVEHGDEPSARPALVRGDVLLQLRTVRAKVVTEWVKLRPVIDEPGPPDVCFQRLPDE